MPSFTGLKLLKRVAHKEHPGPVKPLFDAPSRMRELDAAATLAMMALRRGSPVEIYWGVKAKFWGAQTKNRFWTARVTHIEPVGFRFIFENTKNDRGRVQFDEFLTRWRFPTPSEHFTFETTELLLAARRPAQK